MGSRGWLWGEVTGEWKVKIECNEACNGRPTDRLLMSSR